MKNFLSQKKKHAISAAVAFGLCLGTSFTASAADFSSYFDWRLNNPTDSNSGTDPLTIVSPVEDQFSGTCWTFGAFGSYESSWMKQLKLAQAAGYNVNVAQQIFSKYYMAWTMYAPPVNNMADNSIYYPMHSQESMEDFIREHPIYYQGGDVQRSTIDLIKYGATDQKTPTFAGTDAEKLAAYNAMETDAQWERFRVYAKNHLVENYERNLPNTMTDAQKEAAVEDYEKNLTDEQITSLAQHAHSLASSEALSSYVEPIGDLHDTYIVKDARAGMKWGVALTAEELSDAKELISTEGVVAVSHYAGEAPDKTKPLHLYGEAYPYYDKTTHIESLVGWDDNYTFQHITNSDGSPLVGAFLMRNSWGVEKYPSQGGGGYGYLSYEDQSTLSISHYNAELDAKRFTLVDMNTPFVNSVDNYENNDRYGTQNIANTFQAQTDSGQFLKAVMIYASEKNMPYEIIVREGETPGVGTILTQQSGTFGQDGTAKWGGYRTVDLDNFVFLAKDKKYVVEVRTTSPTGEPVYVALMTGLTEDEIAGRVTGQSYFYDESTKKWVNSADTFQDTSATSTSASLRDDEDNPTGYDLPDMDPSNYKRIYIFTAARSKESASPNGGDFRVSWLDDTNSSGNSIIDLGRANELYGSDYSNPDRTTLSNMTVDLREGIYNTYRGTILGEGSLTKTGAGYLALNGTNTYTGGTFVNNGTLDVNGSIVGDAWATDKGIISGSGYIGGTLYNRSRIASGNFLGYGNLTMQNLVSSGIIATQYGTQFIVNETADIDGSTVVYDGVVSPDMIDNSTTILKANSITGNLSNLQIKASPLVSANINMYPNEITMTSYLSNNIGALNNTQGQSFNALQNIWQNVKYDGRRYELFTLLNLDAPSAGIALQQMGSSNAGQLMNYVQQNSLTQRLLNDRFAGDDFSNDVWVKFTKDWGKLYGGEKFHSQAISVGWDKNFNPNWRGGIFATYDVSKLDQSQVKDTRGGLYANWTNDANSALIYLDAGQVRNELSRTLDSISLNPSAKYHGTVLELGGEYKRDLTPDKDFHLSPFVNLQMSHLKQNSFQEHGAGIFNQHFDSKKNTYFAGQLGLEYRKNFNSGNIAARIGVSHAFSGADPELTFRYEGGSQAYRLRNRQDKTHLIFSLNGEHEFAANWTLGGEFFLQKGSHDRDLSASLFLRKAW